MPRVTKDVPTVSYPERRATREVTDEDMEGVAPLHEILKMTAAYIQVAGGQWTSLIARPDEDPPSGAIHFTLGGKRFVAVFQPLDMKDRADIEG